MANLPKSSNLTNQSSCSPISSRCVIWEGPDLPCINVCKGDSMSEITYKLATLICNAYTLLDLTELDLSTLTDDPDPDHSLYNVLALIIAELAALESATPPTPEPVTFASLGTVPIPVDLRPLDENGDPITAMTADEYLQLLANELLAALTAIATANTAIEDLQAAVTALEASIPEPYVLPNLISEVIGDGLEHPLDEVVEAIDSAFADFTTITGSGPEILDSIADQCTDLTKLCDDESGMCSMTEMPGWVASPTTLAESYNNLWMMLCDVRCAVKALKACCEPTCDDVKIDFRSGISSNGETIYIYTAGFINIPSGFTACGDMTVKVVDGAANSYTFHLVYDPLATDPYELSLIGTGLLLGTDYKIEFTACFTNEKITCEKTIPGVVVNTAVFCPVVTTNLVSIGDNTTIYFTFTPTVTGATYSMTLINVDDSPPSITDTKTFASPTPGTPIFSSFVAVPNPMANYEITITVTLPDGTIKNCPAIGIFTIG